MLRMKYLLLSIIIVFLVGILIIPNAFAVEVIVQNAPGSSVPGCEKTNSCFIPSTVTINVGDTVVWTNPDTMSHIVTNDGEVGYDKDDFDSGLIMVGSAWKHKFTTSGTHDYYCKAHPWMVGKVIVKSGSSSATEDRSPPPTTSESPSTTSNLDSEAELGNIRLQEKLDEYWDCGNEEYKANNQDCIKTDWEKHTVGISPTEIANYRVEKDGTLTFSYEDSNISKKLEKFHDQTLHQKLWDIYTSITPKQILSEVVYFVVYTDDYVGDESASVGRDNANPLKFDLFVDPVDIFPSGIKIDKQYYVATLIHENAHILSLSENQGVNNGILVSESMSASEWTQLMTEGERSCAPNYYNDMAGCMFKNSYLNTFFQKFWTGIYRDHNWQQEYDNVDNFYNHNDMFYKKYSTQFVTEYAASNPDEDFAESFMAFVLNEYPKQKLRPATVMKTYCSTQTISGMYCPNERGTGLVYCTKTMETCTQKKLISAPYQESRLPFSIADQKIIFFYDYPELVKMRDFIRSAIAEDEFCNKGAVWKDGKCQQTGGCLIATAAFGSEMAPQVQQLRELRDNTVLQTESGSAFMTGFNQFYYSFSPAIADYERENPAFKEAVKITLTPLLASLTLLQYADIDSESEMLGYGIGIILLNIGMYFVAPAILIMKIRKRI